MVFLFAGADARRLSTATLAELIVLIIFLGWIEALRHRERALLGNLGVSPLVLSIFFALPALLGEGLLRIGEAALG